MRFVRLLAAVAALAFAGQANALTKTTGTVTTDSSGVAIIPLTPLGGRGHLWYNKFLWSADLSASISVQQDYDLTTVIPQRTLWWLKPHIVIPGSVTTVHQAPIDNYGSGIEVTGSFWAVDADRHNNAFRSSANYMASLIVNATPGTVLNYTLRVGTVPEPSTWALMILGFGGVGAAVRRRRLKPAAQAISA